MIVGFQFLLILLGLEELFGTHTHTHTHTHAEGRLRAVLSWALPFLAAGLPAHPRAALCPAAPSVAGQR